MGNDQSPNSKHQINSNHQIPNTKQNRFGKLVIGHWLLFGYWCLVIGVFPLFAQETKEEPIIVNGDKIEYITEKKDFIATGNAEVNYKGTKLTCQKLTINTETKDAEAIGDAR